MIWIYIVWICITVQDPCPNYSGGPITCSAFHFHIECNEHESFLNRDSALMFMDGIYFLEPELDSMLLDDYIKKY